LRSDLVAGVVLAAILVPQGMAYAELAGLPAVNGLYTTVACLVGYAIFGPSRVLVLGPDSSLGPLIFAAILPLAITDNPTELVAFAGFLALLVRAGMGTWWAQAIVTMSLTIGTYLAYRLWVFRRLEDVIASPDR
jgi:MFS superfamily sulfate permease-like transporter